MKLPHQESESNMRHPPCTALTSCSTPLPAGKKYVGLQFLTKESIYCVVDVKGKAQEIFDEACSYLGLNDSELFGLALLIDGEYHFTEHCLKISKYAPKAWKRQGNGLEDCGKPLLTFNFRVKCYIDCHLLISDKVARHHYYLQLCENLISYTQPISEEKAFLLAAYALQADLGNYIPEKHSGRYFEPKKYFPSWIMKKVGEDYIVRHIPAMHKDNAGLSRGEAQVGYIKEASDFSVPHNLHFYKLSRKKAKTCSFIWLGICFKGIQIYEENGPVTRTHLSTFLWSDIAKLHFEKKKFEIHSLGSPKWRRFTYYTNSEELAKNLLWLCRITHQFHMAIKPRIQELQKLELEGHKPYKENYIYSDSLDLAWEQSQKGLPDGRNVMSCTVPLLKKSGANNYDQRISVISNTSSNTTSGIVSDKVQNFDESEDDLDGDPVMGLTQPESASLKNEEPHSSKAEKETIVFAEIGNSSVMFSQSQDASEDKNVSSSVGSSQLSIDDKDFCSSTHINSSLGNALDIKEILGIEVKNPDLMIFQDNESGMKNSSPDTALSAIILPGENKEGLQTQPISESQVLSNLTTSPVVNNEIENYFSHLTYDSRKGSINGHSHDSIFSESQSVPNKSDVSSLSCLLSSGSDLSLTELNASSGCMELSQKVNIPSRNSPQYIQNPTAYSHGRTTTRIGVSSLTRVQQLPLALFGCKHPTMMTAGSEPNLYNSSLLMKSTLTCSSNPEVLSLPVRIGNVNSQSESDLNFIDGRYSRQDYGSNAFGYGKMQSSASVSKLLTDLINVNSCSVEAIGYGTEDVSQDLITGYSDFPCIPPPPAYRNAPKEETNETSEVEKLAFKPQNQHKDQEADTDSSKSTNVLQSSPEAHSVSSSSAEKYSEKEIANHCALGTDGSKSTSRKILDLQQLRQKSLDLDLPLISALCNDRSLLMLPKTIPTCSRQRHLGCGKDLRRFSYSYVNTPSSTVNEDSLDSSSSARGMRLAQPNRPVSWHVNSSDYLWSNEPFNQSNLDQTMIISPPGSYRTCDGFLGSSSEGSISSHLVPGQFTVLASHKKSSENSVCNTRQTMDHQCIATRQIIPPNMYSSGLSALANERLYTKGQSS